MWTTACTSSAQGVRASARERGRRWRTPRTVSRRSCPRGLLMALSRSGPPLVSAFPLARPPADWRRRAGLMRERLRRVCRGREAARGDASLAMPAVGDVLNMTQTPAVGPRLRWPRIARASGCPTAVAVELQRSWHGFEELRGENEAPPQPMSPFEGTVRWGETLRWLGLLRQGGSRGREDHRAEYRPAIISGQQVPSRLPCFLHCVKQEGCVQLPTCTHGVLRHDQGSASPKC